MSQGDMFLVNLDPTLHTDIGKTRPVLILSIDAMNAHLPRVLVAPVWSNVHKIYLHEVLIFECLKNTAEDLKWQQNDTEIRLGDTFDSREENKMTTTALNKLEVLKQAYPDEKELESVL